MERKYILSADKATMKLRRMAYEVIERNATEKQLVLAGIKGNGFEIAQMLKDLLSEISTFSIDLLLIDIDKQNPLVCQIDNNFDLGDKVVLVIDDVVNSGKTLIYSLLPLLKASPKKIETLTLVERSYKTHPIHVDYVGISLATTFHDHIIVEVNEGKLAGAYLH
jgi:pyrimidine operon attenuation protein/uracil phosphoribosyltransferase